MIPSTNEFIKMMQSGNSAASFSFIFGTIDPAYTTGNPRVKFDGETAVSTKTYKYLKTYTPVANHRVLILKIENSCVILGNI